MRHSSWLIYAVLLASLWWQHAFGQGQGLPDTAVIQGVVRDVAGTAIAGAIVSLNNDNRELAQTRTDARGTFLFSVSTAGTYTIGARKAGFETVHQVLTIKPPSTQHLSFVLATSALKTAEPSSASQMQFDDKSDFVVAGLTDWTAAGGHGSDANLRTSETLAKDTSKLAQEDESTPLKSTSSEKDLKAAVARHPNNFEANRQLGDFYLRDRREAEAIPFLRIAYQLRPDDYANAYDLAVASKYAGNLTEAREQVRNLMMKNDRAELHRLLGDINELRNDPLAAEREYKIATKMRPTEANYFAWALELLVHRAIEPAREIFEKGVSAYPKSERMLAGLGAALYASGLDEQAAFRLCAASDLNTVDTVPYIFLGKMQQTSTQPVPCMDEKFARFHRDHPNDPLANYYYAVNLWIRQQRSGTNANFLQIESLLQHAISLDATFAEAYLQLGIVYASTGNLKSAVPAYESAVGKNPNLAEAHFRLGQAYKTLGDPLKANVQFRTYQQLTKNDAATIERKRREVRQFVIVLKDQSKPVTPAQP